MAQTVKESLCNAGDLGSIPESGRSAGEGNGSPLRYSCLENPMDRGAWQATDHGVAKSQTQLSYWYFHFFSQQCLLHSLLLRFKYYCYTVFHPWYVTNIFISTSLRCFNILLLDFCFKCIWFLKKESILFWFCISDFWVLLLLVCILNTC